MGYQAEARAAYDAVRQSGGPVVFEREGSAVVDEATDTQVGSPPIHHEHYALILSPSPRGGDTFESTARIRSLYRQLVVPAYRLPVGYEPTPGDSVLFMGHTWAVETVDPLVPDGKTVVLYTLMVRK